MSRPSKARPSKTSKLTQRTGNVSATKPNGQITSPPKTQRKILFQYEGDDGELVSVADEVNRGPAPTHRNDLLPFRDKLVMLIEWYWPEIQQACTLPINGKFLLRTLNAVKLKVPCEASSHLVDHIDKLIMFVNAHNKKPPHARTFRNDPRQFANAMAGIPLIGFWSSMRKCERKANRCQSAIDKRAIRSYIQRKHRRLAGILSGVKVGDTLAYRAALKDYDLRDAHLVLYRNPIRLQEAWEAGVPNWSILGVDPLGHPLPAKGKSAKHSR
jgi:hypothetical protein